MDNQPQFELLGQNPAREIPNLSLSNQRILEAVLQRQQRFQLDPRLITPWWARPCTVKVLLLADSRLNFGDDNFGLSTFISVLLNDARNYVRFELTLAHRSRGDLTGGHASESNPQIVRRLPNFRFDNDEMFTPDMYDEVWLFGFSSGRNYLSADELRRINQFMNEGGGVFATGDHGSLGSGMCSAIPRVRSMRQWTAAANNSMRGPMRNDTNETRFGRDEGSQFDDQSDDVPQTIQPKLYSSRISLLLRERYPHPLLCSPLGIINVMPDHPHEGECTIPDNLTLKDILGEDEYPANVTPEIISTSNVQAGNNPAGKERTIAHSFGGICAYDGHRVDRGRVVTDATWHHFVNVNLIGELNDRDGLEEDPIKDRDGGMGFLGSASGRAALEKIKHYYVNLGVWLARPRQQQCFNRRLIIIAFNQHRVHEASMLNPDLNFRLVDSLTLFSIGTHARDVIGKLAGQCRKLQFAIDIFRLHAPRWVEMIDPWSQGELKLAQANSALPMIDLEPVLNVAVGTAMLKLRDQVGMIDEPIDDEMENVIGKAFEEGMIEGLQSGIKTLKNNATFWAKADFEVLPDLEYVVEGVISDESGQPVSNLLVRAVDLDFKSESPLGFTAETDENGHYRIPYSITDFNSGRMAEGGADIVLYIYRDNELLMKTEMQANSPVQSTINCTLR